MFKIFLKKLLFTGLFYIMYIFGSGIIAFLASTINYEAHNDDLKLIISLIIAWPIAVYSVYYIRIGNKAYKQKYMTEHYQQSYYFWSDLKESIKGKNTLLDLLAFATIAVIYMTQIAITVNITPAQWILGTLKMLALEGTSFHIGNTLVWCLVHRSWRKQRYSSSNN